MKKVLGFTVLIVFVVSLALASKPPRNRTTTGSIAAIDASSRSFTIHPSRGSDLTLKVNDKTLFSRKGQKASWADLRVGATGTATYRQVGSDNWALKVILH